MSGISMAVIIIVELVVIVVLYSKSKRVNFLYVEKTLLVIVIGMIVEILHRQSIIQAHNFRTDFGNYDVLCDTGEVSEAQPVPSYIACPVYAQTGEPAEGPSGPELKAEWQVDSMRESCRLARAVMNTVAENIKVSPLSFFYEPLCFLSFLFCVLLRMNYFPSFYSSLVHCL